MVKFFTCHWRAILWALVIVACSVISSNKPLHSLLFSKLPYFDKWVHFILYFMFTLFLMSGFSRQYGNSSGKKYGTRYKSYLYSFIIAITLGVFLELIQEKIGRSKDYLDVIANTLGALLALALFFPLKKIFKHVL